MANIDCSLKRATKYIKQHPVANKAPADFENIVKSIWTLINLIYKLKWDLLIYDKEKYLTLNKSITYQFTIQNSSVEKTKKSTTSNLNLNLDSKLSVSTSSAMLLSLAIPPSDKNINSINKKVPKLSNIKKSYTQALKANTSLNVEDIL